MAASISIQQVSEIVGLIGTVEPVVVNFIHTILQNAQGKTGDQFIKEADDIWASVLTKAQAELATAAQAKPAVK